MRLFCCLTVFLMIFSPLSGDVYLLRNLWKKSSGTEKNGDTVSFAEYRLHELLSCKALFDERIIINGEKGQLFVGLLDFTYMDFLKQLESLNLRDFAVNELNAVIKVGNVRYLVYNSGDFSRAVCFKFDVRISRNPPALPYYFPNPGGGSIHDRIVQFPDRNAAYVTFSAVFDAAAAFYNCGNQLESQGFRRVDNGGGSSGGFFMTSDGGKIVLMSFSDKSHNGFIYMKERKK